MNDVRITQFMSPAYDVPAGRGKLPPTVGGNPDDAYWLSRGSHVEGEGRCATEWISMIAGEPHSDRPMCVDPFLAELLVTFNDMFDDASRQRLRPLLARAIGTAGDGVDRLSIATRCWEAKHGTVDDKMYPPFDDDEVNWILGYVEELLPTVRVDLPVPVLERAREVCEVAA